MGDLTERLIQELETDRRAGGHTLEEDVFEVESRKFATQLDSEPAGEWHPPRVLDAFYGKTVLRVLVRDPEWVFAYWEIGPGEIERHGLGQGEPAGKRLVIRWADVTDIDYNGRNAHDQFDVHVGDTSGGWYQKLPGSGRDWLAELGLADDAGGFESIFRASRVHTPPLGVAPPRPTLRWMRIDPAARVVQVFELPAGLVLDDIRGGVARGGRLISEEEILAALREGGEPFVTSEQEALRIIPFELLRSLSSEDLLRPGLPGLREIGPEGLALSSWGGASDSLYSGSLYSEDKER